MVHGGHFAKSVGFWSGDTEGGGPRLVGSFFYFLPQKSPNPQIFFLKSPAKPYSIRVCYKLVGSFLFKINDLTFFYVPLSGLAGSHFLSHRPQSLTGGPCVRDGWVAWVLYTYFYIF